MLINRTLFRRFVLNRTAVGRRRTRSVASAELLETRALLSTVSLDGGTLVFEADANQSDDVRITATSASSFQIAVGNGDTIDLGAGTDSGFVRSDSDTVLIVTLGTTGADVSSIHINTGDDADTVVIESLPQAIPTVVDAGGGADFVNGSTATFALELMGGNGHDTLIGGQADDAISGGDGNDSLIGGPGSDTLSGGLGADDLNGAGFVNVSISNLQATNGGLLTPAFFATTNGTYDFFNVGEAASASLESLAEDGDTSLRVDAALASGGVNEAVTTADGPFSGGESRSAVVFASATNDLTQYFSFASMLIPSNDAFIGNDDPAAIGLFDSNGNFIARTGETAIVITGDQVWDAGTEVNDEIAENTAGLSQSTPNTGEDENGVITQHPGFAGSDRLGGTVGNVLTERPGADFTLPGSEVARIELTQDDGDDVLDGGRGADTLDGGAGADSLLGGFGRDVLNGGAGDDYINGNGQIRVTVTNLQSTDGGLLTPIFLATTDGQYDFFNVGDAASASLESLAEDGDTTQRIAAALGSGGVHEAVATDNGPLAPGESRDLFLTATPGNGLTQYLSFASMLIPSNDAFIGNDDPMAIDLFDDMGNLISRQGDGGFIVTGNDVWDAGTEVNDEVPENTAGLDQQAPNTGETENGVITQHPGFAGSDRLGGTVGNILTANANADFTAADALVALIEIDQALDSNDIINGGDGNDIINGARGNDTIIGGDGDDAIEGSFGADVVFGNDGADTISGGAGADSVDGGGGNDNLSGDDGSDYLAGGAGSDTLLGGDGADDLNGGGVITVTVTNLQEVDGGLLTPFVLTTGNGTYDFFDAGTAASSSLERLAEDGTTGPRIESALASGGVNEALATSDGPIAPGESRTVQFSASSANELTQYLSFASMFIPSNDAFIGNDDPTAIDLFDQTGDLISRVGETAFVVTGDQVWDAGTEVNDEVPENTAALDQAAPDTGETENGVITQHPGFQGSSLLGGAVGNILTARPNADFTLADTNVARIEITEDDGDDVLHGGSGGDTLSGNAGNDTLLGGFGRDYLMGGAGDDYLNGGGQITVTITNLQEADGGLLTPTVLATTDGVYDFFNVGEAASESLERLAEDGTVGPRIEGALASGGVNEAIATSGGPIAPGESRSIVLDATSGNGLTQFLSFASMFIPSNDAFIGNDDPQAIDLFGDDGQLISRTGANAIIVTGDEVWDAGTEVNDEIPENTAALSQSVPNTGVDEAGIIAQHPGFIGSARLGGDAGSILQARANADFTVTDAVIASIEIEDSGDGNDVLRGGAGNDTLQGAGGADVTQIAANDGDDVVQASDGQDRVVIDTGSDVAITANITADSGATQVAVTGGANFTLRSSAEVLDLRTGSGDDVITIGTLAGTDTSLVSVRSRAGADNIDASTTDVSVSINGGSGNDTISGGSQDDSLRGASGSDEITGNDGSDLIVAGNGRDTVMAGAGADLVFGGGGSDDLQGEGDSDVIVTGQTSLRNFELNALVSEWRSTRDYATRVDNIVDGSGGGERENGDVFLTIDGETPTVTDDTSADTSVGGDGLDVFFANLTADSSDNTIEEELFDLSV